MLLNGLQDVSIGSFSLSNKLQGKENSGQLHQNFVLTITANRSRNEKLPVQLIPKFFEVECLDDRKSNQIEHAEEQEISKDLFVVPNKSMGDGGSDHRSHEKAAGI